MADSVPDGEPYQLASYQKHAKKARTDHKEQEDEKNKTETLLRIVFKKPLKSSTEINIAANVKLLLDTMTKADPMIDVLGFDRQAVFHLNKDPFPSNENKFKQFFNLHPRSNNPALKHQLSLGCILRSSRSISEIKNHTIDDTPFIDWLNTQRIFLEADNLGYETTKVIGFLLKIHPRIVHRDALKETLTTHLQNLSVDPQQVVDLDKTAKEHYQHAMDSGDHVTTYVPPFELFPTPISHTHECVTVSTRTIGIKCNPDHYALLRELFSKLFTNPATEIAHIQFSLSGIISIIGMEAYRNLIRDNNKHFDNMVTIPIIGVTAEHLDTDIHITNPSNPNLRMSLREIFLETPWCHNIETTKTDGRILLVTTKIHVKDAHIWIDGNLEPLFTRFLPKNPRFRPHPEYPIPTRTDRLLTTATTNDYAAKLASSIPNYSNNGKAIDKFSKFPSKPAHKQPRYAYDPNQFPKIKPAASATIQDSATIQTKTTKTAPNTHTTKKTNTVTNTQSQQLDALTTHESTHQELTKHFMQMCSQMMASSIAGLQQDFRQSFAKLDNRYDTLSTQVDTLNKQYQHLHSMVSNLQAKYPSPHQGGDGHA